MVDVVISEFMDNDVATQILADFNGHWDPDLWKKRNELKSLLGTAKAVIVRNATIVDEDLLASAPSLKMVARMGVGLDNIDLEACKSRGIEVCPSIGANAVSVAEYVIASAMILSRGQTFFATSEVVQGAWNRPKYAGSGELAGKIMGIIGFGSIGQVVAKKAAAMNMEVIAYDAVMAADNPAWSNAKRANLDFLIENADVISLHCPKLPETINLINSEKFNRMKTTAILINSARGGIVNEADCAAALRSGLIAGAAIDTVDQEPITKEVGQLFAGLNNVILTPHVAGVTKESNRRIAEFAADNIRRLLG
jgi:(S)-sulfolactate dehydrogenase